MTALLLDLGNSFWKLARSDDVAFSEVLVGRYDELGRLDAAVGAHSGAVDSVWLASVADREKAHAVQRALQRSLAVDVRQVTSTDPMPDLVSGYRKPEQLGIDRLLAMVAARAQTRQPLCVVDAGTAVTIDFVDPQGRHLGGFILPGLRMFRQCLLDNTAIPRDQDVEEQALLGRDTPTAVALAGRFAVSGIVEHFLCGRGALFANMRTQTFVGGGDADEFLGLLPPPCNKLDHLVLRGLAVIAGSRKS